MCAILTMILALALVTGCAKKEKNQEAATLIPAMKEAVNPNTEVKTIVDQNGRVVKIPKEINRVVMVPLPLPSLYYAVTGSCQEIVGIHPKTKNKAEFSMIGVLAPELMNAATDFVKGIDINIEDLLKLRPDIVFFWGLDPKQVEQFEAIGIPAVAVYTVKGGDALETLHLWMKMLEQIFGKSERISELIAHNFETMKMIRSRTQNIPQKKRPKALILYYHDDKRIGVYGKNSYSQFWLVSTGAINVSEAVSGIADVNMEQIYKWNPDIIYISNFSNTMPDELLNNLIENQDWREVTAVKEKKVYKIPSGIYRWYPPSTDASLMLKWMAQKHYPDLFDDYSIAEEIKRHYSRFYHYDLSPEQIERILHPVRKTAKVTTN